MTRLEAPWDEETVAALNNFQTEGLFHPFTCVSHSTQPLVATTDGWVCNLCDYKQGWAHGFMIEPL